MNQVYYKVSSSSSAKGWEEASFTTKKISSKETADKIADLLKKDNLTKREKSFLNKYFGSSVVALITGSNRGLFEVEKLFSVTKYRVIVTTKEHGTFASCLLDNYHAAKQLKSLIVIPYRTRGDWYSLEYYFPKTSEQVTDPFEKVEIEEVVLLEVKEADSDN